MINFFKGLVALMAATDPEPISKTLFMLAATTLISTGITSAINEAFYELREHRTIKKNRKE